MSRDMLKENLTLYNDVLNKMVFGTNMLWFAMIFGIPCISYCISVVIINNNIIFYKYYNIQAMQESSKIDGLLVSGYASNIF